VPPLTPAGQQLATEHMPLARSLAQPFARAVPSHADDFRSVAYLALVGAAGRYKQGTGAKFRTYATIVIIGALRDEYRTRERELLIKDYGVSRSDYGFPIERPVGHEIESNELRDRLLCEFRPQTQALIYLWIGAPSVAALARDLETTQRLVHKRLADAFSILASRAARYQHRSVHRSA
jgi:RNA polymerase sigma factor (sigma-70 family)